MSNARMLRALPQLGSWLLGCIFLLTGCQLFPVQPPQPPHVALTSFAASGTWEMPDQWWTAWNSTELNSLVELALHDSYDLRAALARLDQARATAAQSRSSFFPALDATPQAESQWTQGTQGGTSHENSWGISLAASYEVDLWGRVRALSNSADRALQASVEDVRTAVISVSADVIQAWLELAGSREQLAVLQRQDEMNNVLLTALEVRFRNGLATALDLAQQREAIARTQALMPGLKAAETRLTNILAVLCGSQPGLLPVPTQALLPEPLPMPNTGLPSQLLDARPDIRAARLRLEQAGWDHSAAQADLLPALRLTGKYTTSGPDLESVLDSWIGSLAAGLVAPVLDGGKRRAEVEKRLAVQDERLAAYTKSVAAALSEADTAINNVNAQADILTTLDRQLEASRQAWELSITRYQNGQVEYTTPINQLVQVQQVERNRVIQRFTLLGAQITLARTMGKGWQSSSPARTQ